MAATVLVADDDPLICDVLQQIVEELGHEVMCTSTAAETIEAVERGRYDVVLLDLGFPDCADLSTLKRIRSSSPSTDVLMVTAETDDLGIVAEAVHLGAFDYVPKPIREDDIRIRLTRVLEVRSILTSYRHAVTELAAGREPGDIVGDSSPMRAVVQKVVQFAPYDMPVLIVGETGTGKELVARALHYGGPRRERPFVSINCAALPTELTESELFGHERGAFTGAHASRPGAFSEAEDGTLFLDEIGDMNQSAQASLLKVLEHGEYRSVGGKTKKANARLVIATNQDLETLIRDGRFRKDLYYRVNRIVIRMPPLREHIEDVPLLARHFLRQLDHRVGKGVREITPEAMEALQRYDWPGNVRELRNEVERAYIQAEGDEVRALDLSPEVLAGPSTEEDAPEGDPKTVEDIKRLVEALQASGGRVARAAEMLGVHRNTVTRWMKKFGLTTART